MRLRAGPWRRCATATASASRSRIGASTSSSHRRNWRGELFVADYERAAAGLLADWEAAPESALALVLLLDQIPRNIFRATPRCYASDAMARAVAERAMARGFDRQMAPAWRLFLYMPLHHSENL